MIDTNHRKIKRETARKNISNFQMGKRAEQHRNPGNGYIKIYFKEIFSVLFQTKQ